MCLYPKLIKNRKYTSNKKNGGNIPAVTDPRTMYVPVGCGNCIECRKQKSRSWQVRLLEDIKDNKNARFITLTFSNEAYATLAKTVKENIDNKIIELQNSPIYTDYTRKEVSVLQSKKNGYNLDNQIATLAVRRFLERYRKEYKKSLRHWLVTELGHNGTHNIHLHGIIWTDLNLYKIEKIWMYGYMWKGKPQNGKLINYVNDKTIGYITKYVTKRDETHKFYNPVILTSAGIGRNYTTRNDYKLNQYNGSKTCETYRTKTGHKIALPTYWRNKIYNDEQREKLWIEKLNSETRWVMGNKIDVSRSHSTYLKVLEKAQERNISLGFGSNHIDYDQKLYEQQQRELQQATRIAKGTK